jgi:hypothetical protein
MVVSFLRYSISEASRLLYSVNRWTASFTWTDNFSADVLSVSRKNISSHPHINPIAVAAHCSIVQYFTVLWLPPTRPHSTPSLQNLLFLGLCNQSLMQWVSNWVLWRHLRGSTKYWWKLGYFVFFFFVIIFTKLL